MWSQSCPNAIYGIVSSPIVSGACVSASSKRCGGTDFQFSRVVLTTFCVFSYPVTQVPATRFYCTLCVDMGFRRTFLYLCKCVSKEEKMWWNRFPIFKSGVDNLFVFLVTQSFRYQPLSSPVELRVEMGLQQTILRTQYLTLANPKSKGCLKLIKD